MCSKENNYVRPRKGAGLEEIPQLKEDGELRLTKGGSHMPKLDIIFSPEVTVARNNGNLRGDTPTTEKRGKQGNRKMVLTEADQILADCDTLMDCLGRMIRKTWEIHHIVAGYREVKNAADGQCFDMEEESEALQKASVELVSNLDVVLRVISKRPPMFDRSDEKLAEWDDTAPLFKDVRVVVDAGAIYVKTPPLFNRNRHWSSRAQTDYFATFSPIVARKIQAIQGELPQFIEKNVTLIAAYPDSDMFIPDTDNLDGKTVVDAILNTLPGADCGDCCTFFSASIRSETLQSGAYFTISEGFAKVPDFKKNIQKLEKLFSQKEVGV